MAIQALSTWEKIHSSHFGRKLFSYILRWMVPYSGSIKAEILELKPGLCRSLMKDRWNLRNHLKSIHAVALVNQGELTSGLAFNYGLPPSMKAIVTNFSIEFHKKARGSITAVSNVPLVVGTEKTEYQVEAELFNAQAIKVATFKATWKVSPQ